VHPLLKIAICVELLIGGIHGFLVAEGIADMYPLHATAVIDVRSAPPAHDIGEKFVAASERESVPLGRIRYSAAPFGTVQTISLNPSATRVIAQRDRERVFGFSLTTTVTTFASGEEVIGSWASFGTEAQTVAFVTQLTNEGFTVRLNTKAEALRAGTFQEEYPERVIEITGLLAVFVAGVVSSTRAMRVRAVHQLFGTSVARTVAKEAGVAIGFTAAAAIATLLLWGVVAGVGWRGEDSFTESGLFVVFPIIIAAACCAASCVVASGVVAVAVRRITDQLAGKRPLWFIQVVSGCAFTAVILGAFSGMDRVASSTRQLNGAIQAQDFWRFEPEARSILFGDITQDLLQQSMSGWTGVVRRLASEHGVLLSYLETQCNFRSDEGPCLFVNGTYLERTLVVAADGARIRPADTPVQAYLPPSLASKSDSIKEQLTEWVAFERGPFKNGTGAEAEVEAPALLGAHQSLPVYGSQYRPDGASVEDPLVIVVDDAVYSGDFALAAASQGYLIFFAPGDVLVRALDQAGVRSLVAGIDRPVDLAAETAVRARTALVREGVVLASSLLLACALLIVLSAAYVERQRKPLFLSYVHGDSFARRYGGYLAFLSSIVVFGVLFSVGIGLNSTLESIVIRTGLGGVLLLVTIPFLAANERRFRADFLTHT